MLRANESNIHMLLGHYSHSVGCFYESALHFMLAAKVRNPSIFWKLLYEKAEHGKVGLFHSC